MKGIAIGVKDLKKSFKNTEVLKGVDFEVRHLANPRQVADDLLNRFGLTDAADRRVSTYSGGMLRRLDIAMSLVGTPSVIFLDEPTTGLIPKDASRFGGLSRSLPTAA